MQHWLYDTQTSYPAHYRTQTIPSTPQKLPRKLAHQNLPKPQAAVPRHPHQRISILKASFQLEPRFQVFRSLLFSLRNLYVLPHAPAGNLIVAYHIQNLPKKLVIPQNYLHTKQTVRCTAPILFPLSLPTWDAYMLKT